MLAHLHTLPTLPYIVLSKPTLPFWYFLYRLTLSRAPNYGIPSSLLEPSHRQIAISAFTLQQLNYLISFIFGLVRFSLVTVHIDFMNFDDWNSFRQQYLNQFLDHKIIQKYARLWRDQHLEIIHVWATNKKSVSLVSHLTCVPTLTVSLQTLQTHNYSDFDTQRMDDRYLCTAKVTKNSSLEISIIICCHSSQLLTWRSSLMAGVEKR